MIWTLGPKKDKGEWHCWFAWRPVPLHRSVWDVPRRWVWLQWIERRIAYQYQGWVQENRLAAPREEPEK